MARTTDHATITEGEGAPSGSFFFAVSRAPRIASQRASICRLAGMTRLSFRVIVGESAGSILVAGIGDPGSADAALCPVLPRSSIAATTAHLFAVVSN